MYKKSAVCLLVTCFFLGCSIFKKDNSTEQVNNPDIKVHDSIELVQNYNNADSVRLVESDTLILPPVPKAPLEYMTIEEKAMIEEINLVRADPNSYIQHIDAYLKDFLNDSNRDFDTKQRERAAGLELIRELENKAPLPLLEPSEALYRVAKRHGDDMKKNGFIDHLGSDESTPSERIRDSTSLDGSENLVGGARSVRESVVMLLVDSDDPGKRGHRKTILDASWQYVACFQIGRVKEMPNTWVQLFGLDDPTDTLKALPIRSVPEDKDEVPKLIDSSVNTPETTTASPEMEESSPDKSDSAQNESKSKTVWDFTFMSREEKAMIDEINRMRTNPKGYIKYVDKYAVEMKEVMSDIDPDFDLAVNEIKTLLNSLAPLSVLRPHKQLYKVAKAHGEDNKKHHQLEHQGTDGRQSFDRVKDAGLKNSISDQGVYAPNENLVGGETTVRNSVLALLIDSGIPSRGHRKALIEPAWEYVACYKIGTIVDLKDLHGLENDDMDNCWVQLFAMD